MATSKTARVDPLGETISNTLFWLMTGLGLGLILMLSLKALGHDSEHGLWAYLAFGVVLRLGLRFTVDRQERWCANLAVGYTLMAVIGLSFLWEWVGQIHSLFYGIPILISTIGINLVDRYRVHWLYAVHAVAIWAGWYLWAAFVGPL